MAMRPSLMVLLLAILGAPSAAVGEPLWVAVGYGGRRLSSRDGLVWDHEQRWSDAAMDDDNVLFNVAYGLGRFVAVGGGAKTGHILSTTDGREWHPLPEVKGRVATISFGQGRFVAGHDAQLLYSTDGKVFTRGERLDWKGSVHARKSACGDTEAGFRFVVIGEVDLWLEKKRVSWRGATGDGSRWVHRALDTAAARDVAYGSGHFVVVGPAGLIESSHDGETWQRRNVDAADDFSRITWTGERFVISGGKQTWTSEDGLSWTATATGIPCNLAWAREPAFSATSPVALGVSWGGTLHASRDFVMWQKLQIPTGPSLEAIAFGDVP
jgi:hypothetical protein